VDEERRRRAVDFTDDARLGTLLDDDEVVYGGRAQADTLSRECVRHPVVAAACLHEHAFLGQQLVELGRILAERSASSQGTSKARAAL
jgi:hypothetical protein